MNAAAYGVLFVCITVAIIASARYFYLARTRQSRLVLTADKEYRLRLTDLSARVDELRDQLDQMQRILKEVE